GKVDFFEAVDELQLFGAVHFYRRKTTGYGLFGGAGGVGGAVATDPRIHTDLVAYLAAEQIADWITGGGWSSVCSICATTAPSMAS
ncbi:hypothetical protein, partial [Klebsiella pneumoniae]|uniref:hypothetical protein n=1 Tax=Klebsiella pneumoniae TaxID=573 RepID=UPI003F802E94